MRKLAAVGPGVCCVLGLFGCRMLTPAQLAALQHAAMGCRVSDSAAMLGVSGKTVAAHLAGARRRLGALNTTHAVVLAIAAGLIDLEGEAA